MPKKTQEEILEWVKGKDRKQGDKLVVEEAKPTNAPAIETLHKVVEKL